MITTEPACQPGTNASLHPACVQASPKIQPRHRDRWAVVYVRQSTPRQVLEHQESTALQYALKRKAIDWGWPAERVLIIDDDQGRSGSSAEGRIGFQRLLAEVSLDHVGLVVGIEMSRLARSCRDWHQLLEVCAIFGTLLADQDGLYDPRQYNDRLLLGLKGTLSEAELHILRQRMDQGRLNKARRGELFNHPPMGYVRLPDGRIAMDPDEQVQGVIRLIFAKFEELGTVNAVLQYLVRQGITLPVRPHAGPNRGQLEWHRPVRQTLRNLLRHPIYAGAYTWGRRATDPRRKIPGRPSTGRTFVPIEQCAVFLRDRCPAYIRWEQYQANRQRMADNRARCEHRGAVREGSALLGGLLVCGRCGSRLMVRYAQSHDSRPTRENRPRYFCVRHTIDYGAPNCQSLEGTGLDALVARQMLTVLEPAALELSLSAAKDVERQRAQIDQHWQHRLERARYETDRATRQYHAVEPENRLVARELEHQWEKRLAEQRSVEEHYDQFRREQPSALSEAERERIRALSSDIPSLWHDPRTTHADRQAIVRCLVERVTVAVVGESQHVDVTIRWAGGFTSHHALVRPVARYEQLDNYESLLARILELREQKHTAAQIAEQLNREGYRPPKRRTTFNAEMVRQLISRRRKVQRPRVMASQVLGENEWWMTDLSRQLQIPHPTLYSWIRRGWVNARQLPVVHGPWAVWADAEELDRLRRLHQCPRGWWNRPHAMSLTQPKSRASAS